MKLLYILALLVLCNNSIVLGSGLEKPIKYDPSYDKRIKERKLAIKDKEEKRAFAEQKKREEEEIKQAMESASVWLKRKILAVNPNKDKRKFWVFGDRYDGWCRLILSTEHYKLSEEIVKENYLDHRISDGNSDGGSECSDSDSEYSDLYYWTLLNKLIELHLKVLKQVSDQLEKVVFEDAEVVKHMKKNKLTYSFRASKSLVGRFKWANLRLLVYWSDTNPLNEYRRKKVNFKKECRILKGLKLPELMPN